MVVAHIPKAFCATFTAFLFGCSAAPPAPPQRINVAVPVSCVKAADVPKRPDYAVEKLTPTASDGEKVIALASDWPTGRKYEGQLEAVIAGCL